MVEMINRQNAFQLSKAPSSDIIVSKVFSKEAEIQIKLEKKLWEKKTPINVKKDSKVGRSTVTLKGKQPTTER